MSIEYKIIFHNVSQGEKFLKGMGIVFLASNEEEYEDCKQYYVEESNALRVEEVLDRGEDIYGDTYLKSKILHVWGERL